MYVCVCSCLLCASTVKKVYLVKKTVKKDCILLTKACRKLLTYCLHINSLDSMILLIFDKKIYTVLKFHLWETELLYFLCG